MGIELKVQIVVTRLNNTLLYAFFILVDDLHYPEKVKRTQMIEQIAVLREFIGYNYGIRNL